MQVETTKALMDAIIWRSMEDGTGIARWAYLTQPAGIPLAIVSYHHVKSAIDWEVVARGVWRITGGQKMELPAGVTEEVAAQLARALSEMDADLLTPAAASVVLQVGIYGEVRHP